MGQYLEKEFRFTDNEFDYLSQFALDKTGIYLSSAKKELVYSRLSKRIRMLGLGDFGEYCEYLSNNTSSEVKEFINAITTNVTSFFREYHHFEYLRDNLLPDLISKRRTDSNLRLRAWSAGCSTGKEAYSIASILNDCILDLDVWDVKLLATDVDSQTLRQANSGEYPIESQSEIPVNHRQWFYETRNGDEKILSARYDLKKIISFLALNLIGPWPMKGKFDFIFYRNVAIYFDVQTRRSIVNRMADLLEIGGYLFIGHSESLFGMSDRFVPVGKTIHQKVR